MTAMHRPNTSRREMPSGARFIFAMFAATIGCGALAEEPVSAVFKAREVSFFYRSTETLYPCHELQNRVAVILRAVGARDDIDVRVTGCEEFMVREDRYDRDDAFGRDRFDRNDPTDPFNRSQDRFGTNRRSDREQTAHVRVRLLSPVKVTPEVLKEIDKDKSRRELISRVTGDPMVAMNDPIVFAAQRQTVTLSRSTIRLEAEDCELIDEMSTSVFRDMDVRVVRGAPNCRSGSRIAPQVTVEALLPMGMIQQQPAPAPAPATGQGNADPGATASPPVESPAPKPNSAQQEVTPTP